MSIWVNTVCRNRILETGLDNVFNSGTFRFRTGAKPVVDTSSGTIVTETVVGADAFAAASGGAKALSAAITDTSANNAGTIAHFEFISSDTLAILRGDVTATGGGGDMTVDNVAVNASQQVTLSAGFAITLPAGS